MSSVPRGLQRSVLAVSMVVVLAACSSTTTSPAASSAASAAASVAAPSAAASASTAASGSASAGASGSAAASPSASESAAANASGSAEPSAITGANCSASATAVKFWTSHTPPDTEALTHIVDAFNTANPDICVKMTIVPGAETNVAKLLTAIRGGVAPDVYEADRFTVPQRAAEGVLAELPADVAKASDYLPFAWAETQFQGKTYALPFDTDARALWYNKDLITAAGQDPAQLDMSKGPATIEAVTKIADAINKKDSSGNYSVMGWMPGGPGAGGNAGAFDQGWHYTWGFDYGGKFADLQACKVTPTDPGVVAGYQFMYDWAKAHDPQAVSRWVTTNQPPNNPAAQNPFWTGKLGMTISGDWRIAEQAKYAPQGHYGFTFIPVPKAGDTPTTWAGGWSMALIPDSKVSAQATKFIQYIAGPDGQKVYTKESTHLPTLNALLADPSLFDPQHAQFLALLPTAKSRPPLAAGAAYWDALTTAMGSVELNSKQPMDALKEVETAIQPQLDAVGC
jgi:multiple sugar transport system substrate-binding protein